MDGFLLFFFVFFVPFSLLLVDDVVDIDPPAKFASDASLFSVVRTSSIRVVFNVFKLSLLISYFLSFSCSYVLIYY